MRLSNFVRSIFDLLKMSREGLNCMSESFYTIPMSAKGLSFMPLSGFMSWY